MTPLDNFGQAMFGFGTTVNSAVCIRNYDTILTQITDACALTLLVGWQERHPACKKLECWGAGMVICLERGADLHMTQLMPLPLTASCFNKIQIGFTFLVPAHLGSPGKRAVKRGCVCVRVCTDACVTRCSAGLHISHTVCEYKSNQLS